MTLTNKSAEDQAITVAADSTFATEPGKVMVNGAEQTALTGTCSSSAGLTTIYARMTGDGFEAASSDDYCWLSRDVAKVLLRFHKLRRKFHNVFLLFRDGIGVLIRIYPLW